MMQTCEKSFLNWKRWLQGFKHFFVGCHCGERRREIRKEHFIPDAEKLKDMDVRPLEGVGGITVLLYLCLFSFNM